jgi:hypothetical protein
VTTTLSLSLDRKRGQLPLQALIRMVLVPGRQGCLLIHPGNSLCDICAPSGVTGWGTHPIVLSIQGLAQSVNWTPEIPPLTGTGAHGLQ